MQVDPTATSSTNLASLIQCVHLRTELLPILKTPYAACAKCKRWDLLPAAARKLDNVGAREAMQAANEARLAEREAHLQTELTRLVQERAALQEEQQQASAMAKVAFLALPEI
jgi:hypothetical protein